MLGRSILEGPNGKIAIIKVFFSYISCIYDSFGSFEMITKNHEEEVDAKFNFMDPHDPRKFFNLPTPVADK